MATPQPSMAVSNHIQTLYRSFKIYFEGDTLIITAIIPMKAFQFYGATQDTSSGVTSSYIVNHMYVLFVTQHKKADKLKAHG